VTAEKEEPIGRFDIVGYQGPSRDSQGIHRRRMRDRGRRPHHSNGTITTAAGEVWKIALPTGIVKFASGAVFPVGLMLVVIAGAELFTGNCMFAPI
jgi:hypothetical protein